MKSRFFNTVTESLDGKTVVKTSTETQKFNDEINWYLNIPIQLNHFIPKIIDYQLGEKPYIQLEKINWSKMDHLFLNSKIDKTLANDIYDAFDDFLFNATNFKSKNNEDNFSILKSMYYDKTIQRLNKIATDEKFKNLFDNTITINNIKYNGVNYYLDKLFDTLVKTKVIDNRDFCLIHGDFCFSNIFYFNKKIKVIDPRGSFGEIGIYGDQLYEYAKLSHCINGLYDYIIDFKFDLDLTKLTQNIINYNFHEIINLNFCKKIRELFSNKDMQKIEIIEALLFLSMVPLHAENFSKQIIMLCIGIEKIAKYIK